MLSLGACALAGASRSHAVERPNIVFILMDDLRWDELGCMGHPFAKTPNIDRIAREGVTFRNAFVTTPLCSPSLASFLTGQYAHAHGIVDNTDHSPLSHRLQTFPRHLERAFLRRPQYPAQTIARATRFEETELLGREDALVKARMRGERRGFLVLEIDDVVSDHRNSPSPFLRARRRSAARRREMRAARWRACAAR